MMAAAAAIMGKALHRGHRAATKKENGKGNQVATVNLKPGLDKREGRWLVVSG